MERSSTDSATKQSHDCTPTPPAPKSKKTHPTSTKNSHHFLNAFPHLKQAPEKYKGTKYGYGTRHTGLWTEIGHQLDPKFLRGGPWNLMVTKTTAGRSGRDNKELFNELRSKAVRRCRRATIYHQVVLGFLSNAVDPKAFQEDQAFVEALAEKGMLAKFHPMQYHMLQVIQCDRACVCHRDNGDVANTMVGTTPFEIFDGAHSVLNDPNLDVRTPFYQGDYAITRATKTGHAVTPLLFGERISLVDTSKSSLATAIQNYRYMDGPEKQAFIEQMRVDEEEKDQKYAEKIERELQLASPILEKEGKTLSMLKDGDDHERGNFWKLTMLEYRKTSGTANKFKKAEKLKKDAIEEARKARNNERMTELEATPVGSFYNYDKAEESRVKRGDFPFKAHSTTKGNTFEELSRPALPV